MKNINLKNNMNSEFELDERAGDSIFNKVIRDNKAVTDFASLPDAIKKSFTDMESAIKLNNNPIKIKGKSLKTADEIFTAIKDGSLAGKELGRVEKGFLKSSSTDPALREIIASKFAKDKNVLAELAKMNRSTTAEIKGYLKSKGYADESIKDIIAQMKANGAIDAKGLLVKDAAKVANTPGKVASKKFGTRIKELLSNIKIKKMSWKQLLVWGAGLSIGGYALWYLIKQNSDVMPPDMPPQPPKQENDWGPCLTDLINNKKGKIVTNTSGAVVVLMSPNEKYPKGVTFYSNNRAVNNQTNDKGTWSCIGGQTQMTTQTNENKINMNESVGQIVKRVLNERFLMEQSNDIANDVEDMVDYLDVPVWGNDYSDIYNLLLKYSKNGKYNEFAELYRDTGGFNNKETLRQDIESINAIDANPVLWKRKILALLNQIESGKVVQSSTVPSSTQQQRRVVTTVDEQETVNQKVHIVWDKDRANGGGGGNTGGGGSTRKTYYDCSGVNIETTPLTYGCKDTKIGQIQACLGISSDNKFGPNTRNKLIEKGHDVKNGITKAIYDKVMADCKQGSVAQTATSTEGGADVKYLRTPIQMNLGPAPQMPSKNTSTASAGGGMTDTEFFQSLLDKGYFNKTGIIGRYAYNGPALNPSDKEKIDNILINNYNYSPTVAEPTETGARYVWKRN
jgi:hypothetical protein